MKASLHYHQGVPVHGGGVSRQLSEGVTVSIFGTIHQGIDLDTTPGLSPYDALALLERQVAAGPATADPPALVIFPTVLGEYVLAYRATMRDRHTWFVDAHSGAIVHSESEVDEQSAVGVGAGIQGQRKKVSSSQAVDHPDLHDRPRASLADPEPRPSGSAGQSAPRRAARARADRQRRAAADEGSDSAAWARERGVPPKPVEVNTRS